MEPKQNNNLKVIQKIIFIIQGPANPRYKTTLCKHFATAQGCSYGDKCQFAHGQAELRLNSGAMNQMGPMGMNPYIEKAQNNVINYKIVKCKNWEKDNNCKYGAKCTFAHGDAELRNKSDNISHMSQPIPLMPFMINQNGMPIIMQPGAGFDFNQMQMMPGNMEQNPFMMGMMPNPNIPPVINNENQENNNADGNDKNQQ